MRTLAVALALAGALAAGMAETREGLFRPFAGDLRAEAAAAAAAGRRGVAVMYYFDDCPGCLTMRREVLARPDVQGWYRGQFASVAIDILGAKPLTGFDGEVASGRSYASAAGIVATPSFDFHDLEGQRLYRHVGGIYNGAEFVLLGQYVATGAHASQSFEEFKRSRKGH